MAKKTKVNGLPELTETITHYLANVDRFAQNVDKKLGSGAYEKIMERGLSAMARPMVKEMESFVSKGQHYKTGATLDSLNHGTLFVEDGFIKYKFGFDMNKGGFPALILEYGDHGSPMRMPNEPHFFIYHAVKNNKLDGGTQTMLLEAIAKDFEKSMSQ